MSKKAKKKKRAAAAKKKNDGFHPLLYEVAGLTMIGFAIIIIFEFGIVGRGLSSFARLLIRELAWGGSIAINRPGASFHGETEISRLEK